MPVTETLLGFFTSSRFLLASVLFVGGLFAGYLLGRGVYRLLHALGLHRSVEGTAFERTAQGLGTSTVGVFSQLVALSVYVGTTLLALDVVGLVVTARVFPFLAAFMPRVVVATLAVIVGLIVGDKLALLVSERLRGIKLPEAGFLAPLVKYSVFYVAALLALSQLGVATAALLVLLVGYVFGVVVLAGLALRDLLSAAAAGAYLLLNEPYSIGDRVRVGDRTGIVQEIDLFVTHVEEDGEEHVVPNHEVFRSGVVRVRD
ncbi:MAG: mechanosensitive ion channel domain-containing protein [Halorientalis sp.]